MKALVPAGGKGTRLRPITHTSAKQLVPVANEPILSYVLADLAAAGIRDVGVVVGDTADEIEAYVGDGARWGLAVTYLPQEEPRGLADCVRIARPFLGEEPFVMYLGDNMLRDGVAAFVDSFNPAMAAASIMVSQVREPQRFGVVEMSGEQVVRLVEKPAQPPSDLALVGVYLFTHVIHDAVATLQPSARGELEITEAIQALIDAGEVVGVHKVEGWWKDTGRLEDLLEANRLVLETMQPSVEGTIDDASEVGGTVVVRAGARVENSTLRGPLVIGEDAVVKDSFIGSFTAIGPRCVIEDSEIEHSVIMEGCRLSGIHRLGDSLLGREVTVERVDRKPKSVQLMVGDHGRVGIV